MGSVTNLSLSLPQVMRRLNPRTHLRTSLEHLPHLKFCAALCAVLCCAVLCCRVVCAQVMWLLNPLTHLSTVLEDLASVSQSNPGDSGGVPTLLALAAKAVQVCSNMRRRYDQTAGSRPPYKLLCW
jgi:hypothetical protein